MDLAFQHPTDIYSLAPCRNNDAQDLVAIGGDHSVEVVQVVREDATRRYDQLILFFRLTVAALASRPFILVRV
jgi:hypothetical protein